MNEFEPISSGRTLLVSWSVPPDMQGSAIIAEKFSHLFARDALLMVGEAPTTAHKYARDPSLPPLSYLAPQWPFRGRKLMRNFSFPRILYRLWRITAREKFDRIIAVFPDETYLGAAYLVARWRGIEFWPYFHNTYLENRRGLRRWVARRLQGPIFANSPTILVLSEGMRDYYQSRYPGKRFEVLQHLNELPVAPLAELPPVHSPIRLAFVGSVNETNLDAFRRLGSALGDRDDYQLTTYSGHPPSSFAELGFARQRMRHTKVADHELPEALARHDILLFPHGLQGARSEVEYETIFPTRTIPNLLSGRPILAHCPPQSFLARWLKEHDCAEVVDTPDEAALRAAFERLIHDEPRRRQLVANAQKAVAYFSPAAVAQHLQQLFEETAQPAADTAPTEELAASS